MQIDEIFDTFRDRLAEVELFRKVANETTQKELARFGELARADADHPLKEGLSHFSSSQSMSFIDPETGFLTRYGFRESRVEDRMHQLIRQKNRQYGWLLVEAYEEFEDFLERTYAWLGKHDWTAWRLREFGNIRHPELQSKSFGWYLDAVKGNFVRDPKAILDRLRELDPPFASMEARNEGRRNLRVSIELIANLRHRIVHTRGRISDRNAFIERVLKNSGAWSSGAAKARRPPACRDLPLKRRRRLFHQVGRSPSPATRGSTARSARLAQPTFRHLRITHLRPHGRCRSRLPVSGPSSGHSTEFVAASPVRPATGTVLLPDSVVARTASRALRTQPPQRLREDRAPMRRAMAAFAELESVVVAGVLQGGRHDLIRQWPVADDYVGVAFAVC